jgi:hypothetical protein
VRAGVPLLPGHAAPLNATEPVQACAIVVAKEAQAPDYGLNSFGYLGNIG